MLETITQRRYLLPFKAARLPQQFTDVLVIGGGVAGLRAAIAAADAGADVLLLTKDTIDQSNTWYAQGGIAAVLQPHDSYESHINDTKIGGAGLCDDEAVRITVTEGPQRVLELLEWGANFDKKAGNPYDLAFTREGGHSFARILHAYGDATGKELAQTLINTVRSRDHIRVSEPIGALHRPQGAAGPRRRALPRLIASGKSNAEVARTLVIAISTVKTHTNTIFGKLQVTSCTQAITLARDLQLM